MSATDVAPQPSGPNLQDLKGPTLEDTQVPGPAPDGRKVGEDPEQYTEDRPGSSLSAPGGIKVGVTDKPEPVKIPIEQTEADEIEDNTITNESKENVVLENKDKMGTSKVDTVSRDSANAKVTEMKAPDIDFEDTPDKTEENMVKDSKSRGIVSDFPSERSDTVEPSQPRPLTETSARDGTKMSYHTEKDIKRDTRHDPDRDSSKTPFSVTAERKPLHTAQTRSHSDYYSKTSSSNRYAHIASSLGQFYGFVPDPNTADHRFSSKMQRMRRPPKLVRLATVTMSPKTKPVPRGPSLYYEEPKKPQKVITWNEAMDARPPLRIDMEGPGPTQYSPRNRPLNETNSPAWTFGSKCFIEKGGGSRTSWEKTWFQTPEVWTSKVDFYNDSAWPTPLHYRSRPMLGPRQRTTLEPPSFTIGTRKEMSLSKTGSDKEPSPADYDKDTADRIILKKSPSYTHQVRREGTVIWASKEKVPGPGSYSPKFSYNKPHGPSFSIRSLRREKSHVLGPFSTF